MKKMLFLTLMMGCFLLISCQKKTTKTNANEVIEQVQTIYQTVAQMPENSPFLTEKFCSEQWRATEAKITDFDTQYYAGEIGFFDCDYWVQAQDYGDISISDVELERQNDDSALVKMVLHNLGTETPMRLTLVWENDEWKIDNFENLGQMGRNWQVDMEHYLQLISHKQTPINADNDPYVGVYLDRDNNEPNLFISKLDAGKYNVDIGIFRLADFTGSVGILTDSGLVFVNDKTGEYPIRGIIKLQEDTAIVTFTDSKFDYIENGQSYAYTRRQEGQKFQFATPDSEEE